LGPITLSFISNPVLSVALSILLLELAWKNLEKNDGLVSADPLDYIGACLQLVGLPLFSIGIHLDRKTNTNKIINLDLIAFIVFGILATSTLFLWLIIIAPAQYFVNLFCAGPSIVINSSNAQDICSVHRWNATRTEVVSEKRFE
jgi:hypothetical protein